MIVAVVTTSIHTIQATRVLAWLDDFPYRPEVLYVLTLVWLIFSGPGPYSIDGLASSEGPGAVPLNELVNHVRSVAQGNVAPSNYRLTLRTCGSQSTRRIAGFQ